MPILDQPGRQRTHIFGARERLDDVGLLDAELDLAVALGAAYYGQVRRGKGVRIRGGVARSYYVGIETSAPAVPGVPPPPHYADLDF